MPQPPSTPTGRIVLFGATGYTGDLTARALVAAGVRPVLAGRRPEPLRSLAAELGGSDEPLEVKVGDVTDPAELAGPNVYTLTAHVLAWGVRGLAGLLPGVAAPSAAGALGPVEAFGLDTLRTACAEAGLVEAERSG